jgi:hypothetical protein
MSERRIQAADSIQDAFKCVVVTLPAVLNANSLLFFKSIPLGPGRPHSSGSPFRVSDGPRSEMYQVAFRAWEIAAATQRARMARPLSKTKEDDGTLYKRLPVIEAAIDAALTQDLETLCRRTVNRPPKMTPGRRHIFTPFGERDLAGICIR